MTKDERHRLDKLIEEVGEIRGMMEQFRQHQKILYGNGQPGLVERVSKLEQSRKTMMVIFGVIQGIVVTACAILGVIFGR